MFRERKYILDYKTKTYEQKHKNEKNTRNYWGKDIFREISYLYFFLIDQLFTIYV